MSYIDDITPSVSVTISAKKSLSYDIYVKAGLTYHVGEMTRTVLKSKKAFIISDDTVYSLYGERVKNSFLTCDFEAFEYVIPHGETSKSPENLIKILNAMAEVRMTRSDCIIALGGGVVGDLAGFAAAVYLRGIPFVQVPTTLLAMVDSSVGGKTAIDLDAGKNLAGAFYQPAMVLCDPKVLDTLSEETFADGCAEVIKYAMINDSELYKKLNAPIHSNIEEIICMCINDKREVVETDETDKGVRQLLNLGHTVGHAVEALSDYTISHGSAVAIGMVIITRAAQKRGICDTGVIDELITLLTAYSLPTECPADYTAEKLYAIATADKKRDGDTITLVVPQSLCHSKLLKISTDELLDFISDGLSN